MQNDFNFQNNNKQFETRFRTKAGVVWLLRDHELFIIFMSEIIYFWNNVWVETLHRWKNVKIIGKTSSSVRSCRKQAIWQTRHYSPIFENNTSEQLPESNQVRNYKVIWIWVFFLIVCTDIDLKNMCRAGEKADRSQNENTSWVANNQTLFSQINKNKIHNNNQNNISYLGA